MNECMLRFSALSLGWEICLREEWFWQGRHPENQKILHLGAALASFCDINEKAGLSAEFSGSFIKSETPVIMKQRGSL